MLSVPEILEIESAGGVDPILQRYWEELTFLKLAIATFLEHEIYLWFTH